MIKEEKIKIFNELKKVLEKNSGGLVFLPEFLDSQAKEKKVSFHLYGKKKVSIHGRKPKQSFFAGAIIQKHFVGFYYMVHYSHPSVIKIKNKDLKKALKGKSCFNIVKLDKDMIKEIDRLLKEGKKIYKKEGWI